MTNNLFIRQKQLLNLVGFSASTLWRKVNSGEFPRPVKLGERITAWRYEDIDIWFRNQA